MLFTTTISDMLMKTNVKFKRIIDNVSDGNIVSTRLKVGKVFNKKFIAF